jgi:hypothetical protein
VAPVFLSASRRILCVVTPARRSLLLFALALVATNTTAQSPPRLAGTITVRAPRAARDRDVTVEVTLTNNTTQPAVLPEQVVSVAQLLLEVRDPRNQVVPTMPPPVPQSATVTIAPGQTIRRTLTLAMFSPPLRRGRYALRFRSPLIVGPSASVTIAR